jgi:NADH-quinone oxidoreductase subunit N
VGEFFQLSDLRAIAPELALTVFGLSLLVLDLLVRDKRKLGYWALGGLSVSAILLFRNSDIAAGLESAYGGQIVVDPFSDYFKLIFLIAAGLTIGLSMRYLDIEGEQHGEYYALLLFATMGMMFMAGGTDLVTLYIGLETMAIATYILVGFLRRSQRSNEASVKYFLLGAFSSGVLLYGMSLLYGISGSTNLNEIADALTRRGADPVSLIAMITVAAGLFFKIGAVPFHQWTPDAYEGAPTSVTAFMSVGVKAASFAMMVRVFMTGIGPLRDQWVPVLAAVAVMTITLGNVAALQQTNVKRLLAYSSISHAGFVLLGLIAGNETGMIAIVLYLFVYTFMNVGAWGIVVALRRKNVIGENIDEMNGLSAKHPVAAVVMLIFLLSLAGIPPTAGFIAKYYLFAAIIETEHFTLAVIAALNVAIGLYYYMRVVVAMFIAEPGEATGISFSRGVASVLVITLALTILIGIYPEWFINWAASATANLPVFGT